jgi:hypothetical protein
MRRRRRRKRRKRRRRIEKGSRLAHLLCHHVMLSHAVTKQEGLTTTSTVLLTSSLQNCKPNKPLFFVNYLVSDRLRKWIKNPLKSQEQDLPLHQPLLTTSLSQLDADLWAAKSVVLMGNWSR